MNHLHNAVLGLLILLGFPFTGGRAQTDSAELMSQTVAPLLEQVEAANAYLDFCQIYAPARLRTARDAAARWYTEHGVGAVNAVKQLYVLSGSDDGFLVALEQMRAEAFALLERDKSEADTICTELSKSLAAFETGERAEGIVAIRSFFDMLEEADIMLPLPPGEALQARTSPTYTELMDRGLEPGQTVVPDEFHCYAVRLGNDYSLPDMLLQFLPDGTYHSTFGNGRYGADDSHGLVFESGIFEGEEKFVRWNDYGQAFSLDAEIDEHPYSFECYQRGARLEAALVDFRLGDPQPGKYSCSDVATGESAELELLKGNRYTLGGQTGTYLVTELIDEYASPKVDWQTGPLAEQTAEYFEDPGTGYRRFSMFLTETETGPPLSFFSSSSSSLSVVCTGKGEPVSYPVSVGVAEKPPEDAGGLSGLYYALVEDKDQTTSVPRYQLLFLDGYVYLGEPPADLQELDCRVLKPSGEPRCATYQFKDGTFSLLSVTPRQLNYISKADGLNFSPVRNDITTLDGTFWAGSFSTSGMPLGMDGISFSTRKDFTYTFSPKGRFVEQKRSETTGSDTNSSGDLASAYAFGEGKRQNAGSYTITGNTITFSYDDGRVLEFFIMITDPAHFYLNGYAYSLQKN